MLLNIENTPGVYLYKPVVLNWPKEFYKPKYTASGTNKQAPVFRPTIDWEPNIITNENGEAEVSFFPSEPYYNYTVTINGCDDAGNLGAFTTVIPRAE